MDLCYYILLRPSSTAPRTYRNRKTNPVPNEALGFTGSSLQPHRSLDRGMADLGMQKVSGNLIGWSRSCL